MSQGFSSDGTAALRFLATPFEAEPKQSVLLLVLLLGAAIPIFLAVYWVAFWLLPDSVGWPLRILVFGCAMSLCLFWYRAPLSHAEILLFRVLAVSAVAWLLPTLTATDRAIALGGWIKLLVLFAICCFLARALRHPPTAHVFGLALLAGGVILVGFVLFIYSQYQGLTVPSFKVAREFKGVAEAANVPLNTIPFAAVLSYFMGLCLVRPSRILTLLAVPLIAISTIFTGSRAPMVVLGASVFTVLCLNGLRHKSLVFRIASAVLALSALFGGIVTVVMASDKTLSQVTEGRTHLWAAGIEKFGERPLFGFGYESWKDDLVSRRPGEYNLTYDLAKGLGGGYHNEYVSVLAEEGLIGAFGAGLIVWLMLRSSWLLAFRKWATVNTGQWLLFVTLFLLLRANFEVPGLFGYGQDPVDYLAYIFLAIVLSRFSVEEDYALLTARPENRSFV